MLDLNPMDYHEVYFEIAEKTLIEEPNALTREEQIRVQPLRLIFKNAVLHYLI